MSNYSDLWVLPASRGRQTGMQKECLSASMRHRHGWNPADCSSIPDRGPLVFIKSSPTPDPD